MSQTKEIPLVIECDYAAVEDSSILVLTKYFSLKETFFEGFKNDLWEYITEEMFVNSFVNLLISGKIKAVYYTSRESAFLFWFNYQHEGFYIYPTALSTQEEPMDLLERNILYVINKMPRDSRIDLPLLIKNVINRYLTIQYASNPEKLFYQKYFRAYAKESNNIRVRNEWKYLGLRFHIKVELSPYKKRAWNESRKQLEEARYQLSSQNEVFRYFVKFLEKLVSHDFRRRIPPD